jgi:hypothetical protein
MGACAAMMLAALGHRQHLAVEFTNWIVSAAESLGRTSNSPVPLVVTGTEHYRS